MSGNPAAEMLNWIVLKMSIGLRKCSKHCNNCNCKLQKSHFRVRQASLTTQRPCLLLPVTIRQTKTKTIQGSRKLIPQVCTNIVDRSDLLYLVCSRLGDRTYGRKTFGRQIGWENDVWATWGSWATRHGQLGDKVIDRRQTNYNSWANPSRNTSSGGTCR